MGASSTQEYCRWCGAKALRGRYYKIGRILTRQVLCDRCRALAETGEYEMKVIVRHQSGAEQIMTKGQADTLVKSKPCQWKIVGRVIGKVGAA